MRLARVFFALPDAFFIVCMLPFLNCLLVSGWVHFNTIQEVFRMFRASVLLTGLLFAGVGMAAPLRVGVMKCEYRINPLGIDALQPRLSWELHSEERGAAQAAWQVLVASSPELLAQDQGDLWDSGKVASDQSIQVAYAGAPLRSEQACYWKARVWNDGGEASAWSAPAHWTMGLLHESDWQGRWIGLDESDSDAEQPMEILRHAQWIWYPEGNPASAAPPETRWFRATFTLPADAEIAAAHAHLSVDNRYRILINGEEAGTGSDFSQVRKHNIADKLRPGVNVAAIAAVNLGDAPNPAGLLCVIDVQLKSGDPVRLHTGGDWRCANTKQDGWQQSGFDDSGWQAAKVLGPCGIDPWKQVGLSDKSRLPVRMLRREFTAKQGLKRATAYICGLGLFELSMNGAKVGDEVLVPGLTEYNKRAFYMTFDVTDQVKSGENALGVLLGNGRYFAPRTSQPTHTRTYGYPKMMFQMRLEYAGGASELLVSDTDWKLTTDGPIRSNNEYDGEVIDARMEMPGWDAPGFDDAAWRHAEPVEGPGGVLSAQMAEPIRVTEFVKPIALSQPKPGVYIYDMGQNMVGWCRLRVKGPRGAQITLRHAETTHEDGTLYMDNIRGAEVTNTYILKGEGEEEFAPRFVFHGFRFAELIGYPGEPTLDTLLGEVVHDDVAAAGHFKCSHPLLNQIYSNIRWGVRGNYRSMPTDCPQRDERQGWLGDRSAECKGETYLFDIAALYAKWVCDMEDAQRDDGSVSDVCPSYWPLYNDNVTWPSTFIIAPHMLRTQYGDTRAIERHYGGMKKWITHMSSYMENGLIARDNYGDWCVPPEEKHLIHSKEEKRKTPGELLASAYFIYDLRLMAEYAGMLGFNDDRDAFLKQAENMTEAFNKKFWDAEKGYYGNGSETSQVLPLAFGIAPAAMHAKAFQYLADKIENVNKGHLATGLIGGQWLMRTLSDNGRPDIAYTIATRTEYPSWGYMIDKGATTIWELWNGDTADPAMNSHNHVMLVGDLNIWFHEYLAGIQPDPAQPAFKHIVMKPHPLGDLSNASATYRSLYGEIASAWKIENGHFVWDIQVPVNTTATVYVPAADAATVLEGAQPAAERPGIRFLRQEEGRALYAVSAGQYRFSAPKS